MQMCNYRYNFDLSRRNLITLNWEVVF